MAPGDVAGATFNLGAVDGRLEARLDPPPSYADRLTLDDRAFAVLDRQRLGRVLLVTPGNRALEFGLSTERILREASVQKIGPEAIETPEFRRDMQAGVFDLVIFDQCAPEHSEDMPAANTLFIGRRPPLDSWRANSSLNSASTARALQAAAPQIIDWQRNHPLLALVELGNVAIVDSLIVAPPPGGRVLVDSTQGPLMAIAPRDGYEDVVLGFEIVGRDAAGATTVNTNWPRRYSFPNFLLNVVQYLAGNPDLATIARRPGEAIEIDLAQRRDAVTVMLPDRSVREIAARESGKMEFRDTDQLGIYEVMAGEQVVARFAVNLFDRQESDVRLRARQGGAGDGPTAAAVSIGYVDVESQPPSSAARREMWTGLLLAALVVLVAEWYIYNRRVYV